MTSYKSLILALTATVVGAAWCEFAEAGPLDDLIAGAKKEGIIEFYGPSTLGTEGAQALAAGFNKK